MVVSLFSLEGRTALVTGSSRGIGYALAGGLLEAGARVVIHGRDVATAESAAARLGELTGGEVRVATFDVTDPEAVDAGVAGIEEVWGTPDILVNNAGIGPSKPLLETSLDDFRAVIAINLDAVFLGCRFGAEAMRATPEKPRASPASIVNLSSILGLVGMATTAAYSASKGGVRLLTKTVALEAAANKWDIRVNSVHPGFTWTPMVQESVKRIAGQTGGEAEATRAGISALHPLGRMGAPEEIANAILFLASDESSFMTGSEMVVDGGYTAI